MSLVAAPEAPHSLLTQAEAVPAPVVIDPQGAIEAMTRVSVEPPLEQRRLDLELLRQVLDAVGYTANPIPTVHVTGTNGKGSTSHVVAEILTAAGHRVGHFLAGGHPALSGFPLRQVYWSATSLAFERYVWPILRASGRRFGVLQELYCRAIDLLMFQHNDIRPAVQVIEAGCGGETDWTNVVSPVVSVITHVSLDHTDLFPTVEDIAREKAGIIKAGAPAVTAETKPEVIEIFRRRAEAVGTELHVLDRSRILEAETTLSGTRLRMRTDAWGELSLSSSLVGVHQIENIALAVRAVELLPDGLRPRAEDVLAGVKAARWPGRFQVLRGEGDVTMVFDGAHNAGGAQALAASLEAVRAPRPRVAVLACLARKDTAPIVRLVSRAVDRLVLTIFAGRMHRGDPPWDPWAAAAHAECPQEVEPRFRTAIDRAIELATPGGTVVVAGSLHTALDGIYAATGLLF